MNFYKNSGSRETNNSIDCGLYTKAFVTSFCFRQKLCFEIIFDSNKLWAYLLKCFETNTISEFPQTAKTICIHRKKKDKIIKIQTFCSCNLPECSMRQMFKLVS